MLLDATFWDGGTILCVVDARMPIGILGSMKAKYLSVPERETYRRLEDVVGCKWSAAVVGALHRGISRPGRLERYIPGISTKVLNERLKRLVAYGLATRVDRSAKSLHVDYQLTAIGAKLATIIEQLHALQKEREVGASSAE